MKKFLGVISIAMALVLGIVPMFTDCQSQGRLSNCQMEKLYR
jgi:hypothetical protein